jgi:hypothetical protein
VLQTVIEYSLRLGKTEALKDVLDLAAFALVTPEVMGEDRVAKIAAAVRSTMKSITLLYKHSKSFILLIAVVPLMVGPVLVLKIMIPVLNWMAHNAITRRVAFGLGTAAFLVARGLGIWDAIKVP